MAPLNIVIWVLVGIAALLIGKEVGKWLFGLKKGSTNLKRSFQALAISLREVGLRRMPELLEEYVVGDIPSMMKNIEELAVVAKSGNEAIIKELEGTFERVLDAKLGTPEGRALVKAKLEAAAVVAAPIVKAAAVAAL